MSKRTHKVLATNRMGVVVKTVCGRSRYSGATEELAASHDTRDVDCKRCLDVLGQTRALTGDDSRATDATSRYTPMDLETDDSTDATLALVMKALVSTGSHFTDCIRFSANLGRGISLFMRVQVPKARVSELREALGRRCELKEPPRAKTNARGSTR